MKKMVIAVRKDLNMRKGKLAAQAAHAAIKAIQFSIGRDDAGLPVIYLENEDCLEWLGDSLSTKIVVGVSSEKELLDLYVSIPPGIPRSIIQDAGKTEFKEPTYTAVAVGPAESEVIDRITGHLQLL